MILPRKWFSRKSKSWNFHKYQEHIYGQCDRGGITELTECHFRDIYKTCRNIRKPLIVECGAGSTTFLFFHLICMNSGYLLSCDLDDNYFVPEFVISTRYVFLQEDILDIAIRGKFHSYFDNCKSEKINILLLDAGQEYQENIERLMAFDKNIIPGSIVICHDTVTGGIGEAIMDYTKLYFDKAYECEISNRKWSIKHKIHGAGLTIVKRRRYLWI